MGSNYHLCDKPNTQAQEEEYAYHAEVRVKVVYLILGVVPLGLAILLHAPHKVLFILGILSLRLLSTVILFPEAPPLIDDAIGEDL